MTSTYKNKDKQKWREYRARDYRENKEKQNAQTKKWKLDNKERVRQKMKEWRTRNAKHIKEYQNRYDKLNPEKKRERHQLWVQKNKEHHLATIRKRERERMRVVPGYKISVRLRQRLNISLARYRKSGRASSRIGKDAYGCSNAELAKHIEAQFRKGMTWANYGKNGWVIDHIRPVCSFNISNPTEIKEINHYSNLRPLWHKENQEKIKQDMKLKIKLI